MSAARRLLITGATGKQGGAVIEALLARQSHNPFHIIALTRKKDSAKAQRLASNPNVSLVQGDLDDCASIFKQIDQPWGVFSVQLPLPTAAVEEKRGKALVDAAAANGVKRFVYTSADRGGPRSDDDPTPVAHFASKHRIEKHVQQVAAASPHGMDWTILRPVAFMENMTPDFLGKAFVTMWRLNGLDRKLQMISTKDVGRIAALAFLHPEEYRNKAITLAGDELSPIEADAIFRQRFGKEIPATYGFVGGALKWVLNEQLGKMFDWFKERGFGADVPKLRDQYRDLQTFETWLRESSAFR